MRDSERKQIKKDFCEAVREHEGVTLKSAAKSVGVTYRCILNWRERDPDFDQAVGRAIRARDTQRVSMVEDVIFKRIMEGDAPSGVTIFWLKANSQKYREADKTVHGVEGESESPEKRRKADELLDQFEEEHGIPAVPEEQDMNLDEVEDIVEKASEGD